MPDFMSVQHDIHSKKDSLFWWISFKIKEIYIPETSIKITSLVSLAPNKSHTLPLKGTLGFSVAKGWKRVVQKYITKSVVFLEKGKGSRYVSLTSKTIF